MVGLSLPKIFVSSQNHQFSLPQSRRVCGRKFRLAMVKAVLTLTGATGEKNNDCTKSF